jgi:hypothetical protein
MGVSRGGASSSAETGAPADLQLLEIKGEKIDLAVRIDEKRHREMPELGSSNIAGIEDTGDLRGERPIWIDPRDSGEQVAGISTHRLAAQSRTKRRLEESR